MAKSVYDKALSRIAFTLSIGNFEGASRKKIVVAYSLLAFICVGLLTLTIVGVSIEQFNTPRSIGEFVGIIICAVFAFSLLPVIWLIIIIKNEKIRKEVLLWIKDAVELTAYAKKLDEKRWVGVPMIKLQVEFTIDGINHICTTENERRGLIDLGRPVGYFSWISKYADRKINILYSPKYNQVMVLKD